MIVVREVFNARPDRVDDMEMLIHDFRIRGEQAGLGPARVFVDRTASHYERTDAGGRFVVEREYPSIEFFSQKEDAARDDDRWRAAWSAFRGVVDNVQREILEQV